MSMPWCPGREGAELPCRSRGAIVFGPQTQEEAALDPVSRRLRGRTERLEAFSQAEVERTRDLERAVLVSFLVISSLWGRASAPTGYSPRGSGQLHSSWVESLECWPCSDFYFLQHLDAFRVAAYNRLLGKHRELMEQLAMMKTATRVGSESADLEPGCTAPRSGMATAGSGTMVAGSS